MTAVSSRKAWAVTSHLMFFTATFWPKYSPCRTAAGREQGQAGTDILGLLRPDHLQHPRLPPLLPDQSPIENPQILHPYYLYFLGIFLVCFLFGGHI